MVVKKTGEALVVRSKIQQIKKHLQDNKTYYFVGGGCLAAGYLIGGRITSPIFNTVSPVFNNTPLFSNAHIVNNGGHMRKIVRCLETDEMWPSVSKAAETVGEPISMMSRHLNGHMENLKGLHYVIEGLASG